MPETNHKVACCACGQRFEGRTARIAAEKERLHNCLAIAFAQIGFKEESIVDLMVRHGVIDEGDRSKIIGKGVRR